MIRRKYLLTVLILFVGFISCKKATQYHAVLYFTGTDQAPEIKFTVDASSAMGISVTSSYKVEKDITVNIKIKPEMVDSYNSLNGTAYQFLPAGSYNFAATSVTIKNGTNVSDPAMFSIVTLVDFKEGITYCVPITITDVVGDIPVLESSRTMYLIIKRVIITQAVSLAPNYFTVPGFQTATALSSVPKITMECRVFVNQFQTANPFISSIMGIEENFLLRFGDVSIANNQVQLAGGLINTKKFPVTGSVYFLTGQWYHVAIVYNGTSMTLYINGVRDNYTDAETGGINLTDTYMGGFHIGQSAGGRTLKGYVSEARVWTRALTATELQNNLCYVDPASPGLLAYWRFNGDATGANVTDLTGHGYTAVATSAISWVAGVRCPN
jgi:Domain of unknown function (DUF1735)/Concanavalin A-like lectin/glucanases superfamily